MPAAHRLPGSTLRSFRAARRVHGTYLSIGVAPLSGARRAQLAIIVSKKVAAKATARNLMKRRLRAVALPALTTLPPLALVVTLKRGALEATFAQLKADLAAALAQVAAH